MNEYVDIEYRVILSVHVDDQPTADEVIEALWDGLPYIYDQDAISVTRVVPEEGEK